MSPDLEVNNDPGSLLGGREVEHTKYSASPLQVLAVNRFRESSAQKASSPSRKPAGDLAGRSGEVDESALSADLLGGKSKGSAELQDSLMEGIPHALPVSREALPSMAGRAYSVSSSTSSSSECLDQFGDDRPELLNRFQH